MSFLVNPYAHGGADPLVFHGITFDTDSGDSYDAYEMLGVKTGTGDLTEARASEILVPDHEDVFRSFGSGEAAYKGGRVVTNELSYSEDHSNAYWTKTGCSSDGELLTEDTSTGAHGILKDLGAGSNSASVFRVEVKAAGRTRCAVVSQDTSVAVYVDLSNGTIDNAGGALVDYGIADQGNGWYLVTIAVPSSSGRYFIVRMVSTGTTLSYTGDGSSGIRVRKMQLERVTGRSDQSTPSEYVPTTTAAVTKVFANENGNSVVSNVVTEATGSALASAPWVQAQPALTNSLPYSLPDAVNWTETGTSVIGSTTTGLDGAADSAVVLTDDDGAAYEYVREDVTIVSSTNDQTWRVFIKKDTDETRFPTIFGRLTGGTAATCTININTKTGATSVAGTGSAEVRDAGLWWECLVSVTDNDSGNSIARLEIYPAYTSTLGGAASTAATGSITCGGCELHLNKTIAEVRGSGPIFTSSSAVSTTATDDSFDDEDFPATEGGAYIEWTPQFSQSEVSGDIELLSLDNNAGLLYYDATNSQLEATDGTNTASVALTIAEGTTYKCWVAWGDGSLQVGVNASTGTATSYDGAFATGTKIEALTPSPGAGLMRNIRLYSDTLSNAVTTLQGLAA